MFLFLLFNSISVILSFKYSLFLFLNYTGQRTIKTQDTKVHALSGIQTLNPSNQVAADLNLRPHGHRDRQQGRVHLLLL
jgi:hypothetical protein